METVLQILQTFKILRDQTTRLLLTLVLLSTNHWLHLHPDQACLITSTQLIVEVFPLVVFYLKDALELTLEK
jgi:hypothetical protein